MLELVWKGKKEGVKKSIQAIDIEEDKIKSIGGNKKSPNHKIYEGDNLKILINFENEWQNKFHFIYIDPPYNTGANDFFYHDNFKKQNDADRHSSWLNFIYPRLQKAKSVLNENGAIFISIDDYELYHLKLVCDEIFGESNFVANFVRVNKTGAGHDSKKVAVEYDYVLCYAKNFDKLQFSKEIIDTTLDPKYKQEDQFVAKRGKYYLRDLDYRGSYSSKLDYAIEAPDGSNLWPGNKKGRPNTWRWSKEKFEWGIENGFIEFIKREKGYKVYIKQYQFVDNKDNPRKREIPHRSLIKHLNSSGSTELKKILNQSIFSYPKPKGLIQYFLAFYANQTKIEVLDFFAGSGTTMQAVIEYNAEFNTAHNCTLVNNNENNICEEVTYLRNSKIIKGYLNDKGERVKGFSNNNLRYFKAVDASKSK